jgi:hypothetical protein
VVVQTVVVVVGAWAQGNILPITGDIRDPTGLLESEEPRNMVASEA